VYSKRKFVIIDDVFSGLDATTENEVFHNLLGREGLFRSGEITTVVASSDGMENPALLPCVRLLTITTSSTREERRPYCHHGQGRRN
jgi:hypothetical protein